MRMSDSGLMKIVACLIFAVCLLSGLDGGAGDEALADRILSDYSEMQYSQARVLAQKDPGLPEARLVAALCAVYDRRSQDLDFGMSALKKLYEDKSLKQDLRIEAGLAYARAAQTLKLRPGVYPPAASINYNKIYDEIIALSPSSKAACFTIAYQSLELFESADEADIARAFAKLAVFIQSYEGPKQFLGSLHYLLADQYIIHGGRYELAVKHLEVARELGIANPRNREQVAFRIARIYDINLNDKSSAEKNYNSFLKEFPNSAYAPVVKRYLSVLSDGKKEAGNG